MRAVVQRVKRAEVRVGKRVTGKIEKGLLVFIGVEKGDTEKDADYIASKVSGLRIFEDSEGKMNLGVVDAGGAILAVSQFTLAGDTRKGKRPSFMNAENPDQAVLLYKKTVGKIKKYGITVEEGVFQAEMEVDLINHGPVTILLDSKKTF